MAGFDHSSELLFHLHRVTLSPVGGLAQGVLKFSFEMAESTIEAKKDVFQLLRVSGAFLRPLVREVYR